jgi:hypothetical protein
MADQGFYLEVDEAVLIDGYWEADELKAAQVTRKRDGATIALRDQAGRPAWAGNGLRATGQQGSQGTQGQESSAATGQADVSNWLVLGGKVISIDSSALVVEVNDGQELVIQGRPWLFAQSLGFSAADGDKVDLTGHRV